ncbi:F-box only protein 5 [Sphaeramia orbicularis]|uniref:ZBR-type domain-containing protein n=1 Tax=Sphaeramia orbicularis TaxID=375764 RepID=A0A673CAC8_9TELE|nr:F-box only protein 5 [Sphaeramia orbicularis]
MPHSKRIIMKFPRQEASRTFSMDKNSAAAESKVLHLKSSPVKEPPPCKPLVTPADVTLVLSHNNDTKAVHNKENNTNGKDIDRIVGERLEDSGYLSLHNSQIEEEDDHFHVQAPTTLPPSAATHQQKTISPKPSPTKCQGRMDSVSPVASTPVLRQKRVDTYSMSSTPSDSNNNPYLPILKFEQAVCEELAKSFQKTKRYDWSVITKVAEDHLLDRVIGRQMGLAYIDIFSSLLTRNMRGILTCILALLGDMDLISCQKVSKTWRKIICEDSAALKRCQQAEQALRESGSSLRQKTSGLTRDVAVSRMVLSCVQSLASPNVSSSSPLSSIQSCKNNRLLESSSKGRMPNTDCTRFKEYVEAASTLKQHESLRHCKRCNSPATHFPETQRATCTRLSCLFDFCTRCQEGFHGSMPCRVVQPRPHFNTSKTTTILPGSARSKRNIRRL